MSAHLSGENGKPLLTWREIEGICSQAHDDFTDTMIAGGFPSAVDYEDQSDLNRAAKQMFVAAVARELGYRADPPPPYIPRLNKDTSA